MLDSLVVVLRTAIFISLLQSAGVALFISLFNRHLTISKTPIYLLGKISALSGATFILVRYLLEPIRLTGSLSGFLDFSLHEFLITSNFGFAQFLKLLGTIIVGASFLQSSRLSRMAGIVGACFIAASFSLMGHVAASEQQWVLAILLTIHLLLAAFWFGALIPLHLVCSQEKLIAAKLVKHFSKIASFTVPLIPCAGLGIALILLPSLTSLKTPYGIFLTSKIIGFSALMGIAAFNKFKLGPSLSIENHHSISIFKRAISLEILLIIIVLCITATMTTLYSPET